MPEHASRPILIWGGSSSVGQFALQVLRYYGYRNLIATASKAHHELLRSYGAKQCFDYRSPSIVSQILDAAGGKVPFVLDCIGSKYGSLAPIAKIAGPGTKVAVLLPVIIKDASETEAPEYAMDVKAAAEWVEGVDARGVRTHFYLNVSSNLFDTRQGANPDLKNEFFKEKLQSEIMPTLLEQGIVRPNRYRLIEGKTLLERAQAAIDALRRKEVSGERLVWRVAE